MTSPVLADRAIRGLLPRALARSGAEEAASRTHALEEVNGAERARTTMPALERIARATRAPPDLIRAASQCAGALLRAEQPGGEETGQAQLLAAVTRLAVAAVRSGMAPQDVVAVLAS